MLERPDVSVFPGLRDFLGQGWQNIKQVVQDTVVALCADTVGHRGPGVNALRPPYLFW